MSSPRYTPRNPRWLNRLLRHTFGAWLRRAYAIEGRGLEVFDGIRGPFVIVGNHVSTRDVFLVSLLCPRPVYWVGTDAHFRTTMMRLILGLVGAIPKSKVIPDFVTVDTIVKIIRKKGGVVGLYPEGQQCWDGRSIPIFPSTAKLLKLLKVPVVLAKLRGANASLPRWTWRRRRGGVELEFSLLLGPAEIRRMEVTAIHEALVAGIEHDELAWVHASGRSYSSPRRAEHLELALFMCPECSAIGTLRSRGRLLSCGRCGAGWILDSRYRFRKPGGGPSTPADIRVWEDWQRAALDRAIATWSADGSGKPLFIDEGVKLLRGSRSNAMRQLARGRLALLPDRLELLAGDGTLLEFHFGSMEGTSVLTRQIFEFYVGRHLYQMNFPTRQVSARKWQMAVESLQAAGDRHSSAPASGMKGAGS